MARQISQTVSYKYSFTSNL
uniref:Uncharacterized protein n=1 Tax=Arundo donax TaxID=35708 RepID=A0A0A8YKP1_ARUDO